MFCNTSQLCMTTEPKLAGFQTEWACIENARHPEDTLLYALLPNKLEIHSVQQALLQNSLGTASVASEKAVSKFWCLPLCLGRRNADGSSSAKHNAALSPQPKR